jgi:hypothetical protein
MKLTLERIKQLKLLDKYSFCDSNCGLCKELIGDYCNHIIKVNCIMKKCSYCKSHHYKEFKNGDLKGFCLAYKLFINDLSVIELDRCIFYEKD